MAAWIPASLLVLAVSVHGDACAARPLDDAVGLAQRAVSHKKELAKASEEPARFAVVRPFFWKEVHALHSVLASHSTVKACDAPLPVDLVLYYDKAPNRTVEEQLRAVLEHTEGSLKECYRQVHVKYAGLDDGIPYPAAPCTQFVGMFTTKPAPFWGYSAIFMMELDEQPVRSGWLSGLLPVMEQAARGEAWVVGGTYDMRCMEVPSRGGMPLQDAVQHRKSESAADWVNDGHINGNAVYSSSPEFVQWMTELYGSRQGGPGSAMDHCLEKKGRQFDNHMYLEGKHQGNSKKWRADSRFMNCKPGGIDKYGNVHSELAHSMGIARIRDTFPDALVVHTNVRGKSTHAHTDIEWLA